VDRFAPMLDALSFTPSRVGKLRLLQEYFAVTPDPDRGWALAALTGELSFPGAKPAQIRALALERVDAELFALSHDFVGDLAETVALIWPARSGGGEAPQLAAVVEGMMSASRETATGLLRDWMDALDATGRWALLKLVTGELRVGVSARLAKTALAEGSALTVSDIEAVWHGLHPPYRDLFAWVSGRSARPELGNRPTFTPLMLAQPLEESELDRLDPPPIARSGNGTASGRNSSAAAASAGSIRARATISVPPFPIFLPCSTRISCWMASSSSCATALLPLSMISSSGSIAKSRRPS
jgi:DNA ligase-1